MVIFVHVSVVTTQSLVGSSKRLTPIKKLLVNFQSFFKFFLHGSKLERLTSELFPSNLKFGFQFNNFIRGIYMSILSLNFLPNFTIPFGHELPYPDHVEIWDLGNLLIFLYFLDFVWEENVELRAIVVLV